MQFQINLFLLTSALCWVWNFHGAGIFFKTFLKGEWFRRALIFFLENSTSPYRVNLCAPKTWLLQVISKWHSWGEWTEASAFSFEIQHHSVASLYVWLTPFNLGRRGGIHSPPGFSLPVATNINWSVPNFLCLIFYHGNTFSPKMKLITFWNGHVITLVGSHSHIFHCIYIEFPVFTFSCFWHI